jgi:hypothetical protein
LANTDRNLYAEAPIFVTRCPELEQGGRTLPFAATASLARRLLHASRMDEAIALDLNGKLTLLTQPARDATLAADRVGMAPHGRHATDLHASIYDAA